MMYSIDQLRQVKGIGEKTIQRIIEQFDESEYISEYNPEIHIEPNSLINGDMLEKMNGIYDKSVDMILTDLPYGTTANSWDEIIPFDKMWKQYKRVIKDNGAIVLFAQGKFVYQLIASNVSQFKYDLIWDKRLPSGFLNARVAPLRSHENILVFCKTTPTYNPIMRKGKANNSKGRMDRKFVNNNYGDFNNVDNRELLGDMKFPKSVINIDKIHPSKTLHPTQKPIELLEYLIKTYTNEGELVLDSTMGAGSTCVAAKNTGRKYIGIELDKEYFEIAKKRVEEL